MNQIYQKPLSLDTTSRGELVSFFYISRCSTFYIISIYYVIISKTALKKTNFKFKFIE